MLGCKVGTLTLRKLLKTPSTRFRFHLYVFSHKSRCRVVVECSSANRVMILINMEEIIASFSPSQKSDFFVWRTKKICQQKNAFDLTAALCDERAHLTWVQGRCSRPTLSRCRAETLTVGREGREGGGGLRGGTWRDTSAVTGPYLPVLLCQCHWPPYTTAKLNNNGASVLLPWHCCSTWKKFQITVQ